MRNTDFLKLGRPTKISSWLSLVLSLWLVVAGVEGAVLCFGFDGHLQIEFAQDAGCSQAQEESLTIAFQNPPGTSYSFPSAGENCGPCIDIVLSVTNAVHISAPYPIMPASQQQPSFARVLPDPAAGCAQTAGTKRSPEQTPSPESFTLAHISSVILLI